MPAKQHDFTATEIKAGIMVLASLIILVGFLVAIRGCRPKDDTAKTFTPSSPTSAVSTAAQMSDSEASGLAR